jgi:hypothetical protein
MGFSGENTVDDVFAVAAAAAVVVDVVVVVIVVVDAAVVAVVVNAVAVHAVPAFPSSCACTWGQFYE